MKPLATDPRYPYSSIGIVAFYTINELEKITDDANAKTRILQDTIQTTELYKHTFEMHLEQTLCWHN